MKETKSTHVFDKLSKPARRALANAGINNLQELSKLTEKEFMKLHGIGKSTLATLRIAMEEKGILFAG
ncbi:DNA-directed RNA polymerase subunit alpha C-terminal domain-containing protein [Mucilaginibacter terrigena]|nr:DNA-directed RNA polymerase subunit alpha C-terminal domain-containing protein [Mucilaginibacter terrigena]